MEESMGTKFSGESLEPKEILKIKWAAETVASAKHPERNEDSILSDSDHQVFGVFDGMGGHSAGDVASKTARDYILTQLKEVPKGLAIKKVREILLDIIQKTDKAIIEASRGSATTGVILKFYVAQDGNNYAVIANIGDSRVYKKGMNGKLQQITVDDDAVDRSFLEEVEKINIAKKLANSRNRKDLNTQEYSFFEQRNKISKALGFGPPNNRPRVDFLQVIKGEQFVITSDGVHDNLTTSEIEDALNQPGTLQEITKNLIKKSIDRSNEPGEIEMRAKSDDMSAILVEIS